MGKIDDKVAIVTGASRGIGRAIALEFAREGADVVVNYLKSEKEAKEVGKQIEKIGQEALLVKADVSKPEEVKELVEKTIQHFKRVDILVNNAGIVFDVPFKDRTFQHWEKTLHTNLIGTFFMCKEVSHYMKKDGKIVNISSTNGIDSFNPDSMDYDASKAGVNILTRDLAQQLAPIRVNAVAPGWVNTDINKDLPKDYIKSETEKIYLKRFASPEEIAKVVLFLVSDDSSFITGSILKVDGGYG